IFRNTISGTGSGINLSGTCDPVNRSLVANNTMRLTGGNSQTGISLGGSGYDVLNNSVQVSGTYAKGLYCYEFPANVDLVNNIFSVTDGLALEVNYYSPAANKLIDHNCYFSTGTELLTLGGSFTSLAGLQAAYPTSNQHSLSLNPHFSTDMHTQSYWLRHVGATRSEFSDDMDLEPRTGGYDIGADQQTGPLVNPVMSGLYTIGASGCNFTDLQSFFDAISLYGINGDVIVTLTPGVYAGNNHLESYYRTSPAYGISILGTAGSSINHLNVSGDYSQNYIIKLNGADKVTFNGITCNLLSGSYSGSAILLTGRCDDLIIANSSFVLCNVSDTAINGGTSVGTGLRLVNCTIQGGATGLSTSGSYYGTLSYTGVEVTDCTFTGTNYPLSLNKLIGVSITGNSFTDFITGVNLNYSTGDILISGNRLRSGGYYGSFSGGICMNLSNVNGSANARGQILNNIIYADNSQCQGLIGLIIGYSSYLNLDHNSIYVENVNANDYGSALNLSSVSQISSYNNIFSSPVNGYAVNVTGTDLLWSHNVYYSSAKFLGSVSNTVYDPGTLIALYLNDAAGIYANPIPDSNGYSQCSFLRGEGTLTAVTTDIDGNPHSNPPDPGATLIPNYGAPLAGTVNVGSSGTFPDLPTALTALIRRGISAAVTLQLSPGNQPVHASLSYVPNSLLFPVTITGNPVNAPILTHTATGDADNYILRLNNTYNLTLSNLAFHSGNTLHALNLELRSYTKDLSVDNCTFSVNPNTTNSLSSTAVLLSSYNYDGISLTNNHITNLSYGFHIYGANVSNRLNTGLELTGNTIANPAVGIYLGYSDSAVIASNEITGFRYWGARLNYGLPELYIANNSITGDGNAGLSLYYLGTNSGDSYITNNYIRTGVGASGTLTMDSASNVHSYFNTLVNTYPGSSGAAFWQGSGCTGLSFVNNICRSSGAKAASFNQMSDLIRRDHNLFYTTGSTVVNLGGTTINGLPAWTATTGDSSSLFSDPLLEPNSFVLAQNSPAINAGIAIEGYAVDIVGNPRIQPDLGCFEFTLGVLGIPQNLQISLDEASGMITLSWTPVSFAAGYKVYRNTLPGETGWTSVTTANTSIQLPISSGYRFFRVTALDSM
ncbi:MAG TPA: right-handed parallel beta-helix repeat-containing protein, partial [Candidatus Cloacimonadota bacterium]|nr:right-handed parallel beta-helix repeat-containing protein [Candidatus Cloacimonadota bacterium]